MKGTIEIDSEEGTVTIHLENGSYCIKLYPKGIKAFLEQELKK